MSIGFACFKYDTDLMCFISLFFTAELLFSNSHRSASHYDHDEVFTS